MRPVIPLPEAEIMIRNSTPMYRVLKPQAAKSKRVRANFNYMFVLSVSILITSCASLNQGWERTERTNDSEDYERRLTAVQKIENSAETKEEVAQVIAEYEGLLKPDSAYATLAKIGNYYMLMGAGHSDKKKEKKKYYQEAIKLCEQAMLTNMEFNKAMSESKNFMEHHGLLTIDEIDAMGYWYTTRFYYFKECLSPLGRLFNTGIVRENNTVIEQIDQLDSTWAVEGIILPEAFIIFQLQSDLEEV